MFVWARSGIVGLVALSGVLNIRNDWAWLGMDGHSWARSVCSGECVGGRGRSSPGIGFIQKLPVFRTKKSLSLDAY